MHEPAKRRRAAILLCASVLAAAVAAAQAPSTKELMLDLIHPASNDLILTLNRNGPSTDQEWAAARRNALAIAESGAVLMPRVNSEAWRAAARQFAAAGADAYKAAEAKDTKALAAASARIDASCTACHRQFRPNVFPKQGA